MLPQSIDICEWVRYHAGMVIARERGVCCELPNVDETWASETSALMKALDMWAGCISGTIPVDRYRAALVQAGFEQVDFDVHTTQRIPGVEGLVGSAYIRARKPEA